MRPFEEHLAKHEVTPGQWGQIDQNLAAARDLVCHLTQLQVDHVRAAHTRGETCETPCTSHEVINHMAALEPEATLMILHMLICDAAQVLIANE